MILNPRLSRTLPATVGLNAINMSQLPPAGIPTPQVVLTLTKGGLTRMFEIGIANDPDLLSSVTV
jgi:hypothetical protein